MRVGRRSPQGGLHILERGHIDFVKLERLVRTEPFKPVALQLWGVIGVEIVEPDHLFAARQKGLRDMRADKACSTGQ